MCATSDEDDAAAAVVVATDVDSRKLSLKQQQKQKEERNHNTLDYTHSRTGTRSGITSECRVREPSNSSYLRIGLLTFTLLPHVSISNRHRRFIENRLRELKFRCFQNEISSSNGRNDDNDNQRRRRKETRRKSKKRKKRTKRSKSRHEMIEPPPICKQKQQQRQKTLFLFIGSWRCWLSLFRSGRNDIGRYWRPIAQTVSWW